LHLGADVKQCPECLRYWSGAGTLCNYCADPSRDDAILMVVEKDQDLIAVERANAYRGRYFVLGGVLTLSGKGHIREHELVERVERRSKHGLGEIVLALSATSEHVRLSMLGRGLSTGSELEYSDAETLSGALHNRKET
jgi:recombination protein RecR